MPGMAASSGGISVRSMLNIKGTGPPLGVLLFAEAN